MKKTTTIILLLFAQLTLFAQHEWVLQRWTQAYGDTNNQRLGTQVGYLGKKGDTTIVSVTEANEIIKVYYIKTPADTIPRFTLKGLDCTTGDFNGDSIQDLLVNGNPTRIYLGLSEGEFDTIPFFEKYQEPDGYLFGEHVAVGKINGDIYDDLLITDSGYPNGNYWGRVYIFLGGGQMNSNSHAVLNGTHSLNFLGWNVSAGDLNGDGFDDIIVRGYDQSEATPTSRKTFTYIKIFLGGNTIETTEWKYLKGNTNSGLLGLACFDVNGDSVKDLLWTDWNPQDSLEYVNIYFSNGNIEGVPSLILKNPGVGTFGWEINNVGDMNGDSFDDILVSAYYTSFGVAGYVFVFSGGPKIDGNFDAAVGKEQASNFGYSASPIGDINGDRNADIIVGARFAEWFREYGYWGIFLGDTNIHVTSVKENKDFTPEGFQLFQNYPNPFNPSTTIEYTLRKGGNIILKTYNLLGEEIKTLVKEYQTQGSYKVKLDADNLPSGTYYYTLTLTGEDGETHELTKQMVLIK